MGLFHIYSHIVVIDVKTRFGVARNLANNCGNHCGNHYDLRINKFQETRNKERNRFNSGFWADFIMNLKTVHVKNIRPIIGWAVYIYIYIYICMHDLEFPAGFRLSAVICGCNFSLTYLFNNIEIGNCFLLPVLENSSQTNWNNSQINRNMLFRLRLRFILD